MRDPGMGCTSSPCQKAMPGGLWILGGTMTGSHAGVAWTMMGANWRNTNGSNGMAFAFTTA